MSMRPPLPRPSPGPGPQSRPRPHPGPGPAPAFSHVVIARAAPPRRRRHFLAPWLRMVPSLQAAMEYDLTIGTRPVSRGSCSRDAMPVMEHRGS